MEFESKIWYHGTPDVRDLEKEGGFSDRVLHIEYVEDIDTYEQIQRNLASLREDGKEDEYFDLLNTVSKFRKKIKIKSPVFLSDNYGVAKSYADPRRSLDYQGAEEKVLEVKLKPGKTVTINANGDRFRFIDINKVKKGFISAGVDEEELNLLIRRLNFALGVSHGIKTDDIAAIGDWFGFDYIDVVGVLDSYEGGKTKSTVRMVFNPSNIQIAGSLFKEILGKIKRVINESSALKKKRIVAGVLIKCLETDNVFLLLRNDPTPTWALVSGTIDEGENVLEGLKRELYEELFVRPSEIDFKFIRIENIPEKNIEFHYYEGFVDKQFTPILDEENLDGKWFSMNTIPQPLYKGLSEKLEKIFKNPELENNMEEGIFSEVRILVRKILKESVLNETTKASFEAYHGSENQINKFEDSFLAGEKVTQHHGAGIYFTTNYDNARMFGNNVYKVNISGNFLDRDTPSSEVDIDKIIALMKMSDEEWEMEAYNYNEDPNVGIMIAAQSAIDYAENEADVFLRVQSSWYQYQPIDYVRNMTKLGYDGMIVDAPRDFVGDKHIILFNPNAVEIVDKLS